MKYYYYIVINSPAGIAGYFYRDDKHPLDPEAMARHQALLCRAIQLRTCEIVTPEEIAWTNLIELPTVVSKVRWPEDFTTEMLFSKESE